MTYRSQLLAQQAEIESLRGEILYLEKENEELRTPPIPPKSGLETTLLEWEKLKSKELRNRLFKNQTRQPAKPDIPPQPEPEDFNEFHLAIFTSILIGAGLAAAGLLLWTTSLW